MFSSAFAKVYESTYFLLGASKGRTASCGTAFMVAPGVVATVAHILYKTEGDSKDDIRVMRAPEIAQNKKMEMAAVIAIDAEYDIGLLRITNPRTKTCSDLMTDPLLTGTEVGALGFPLTNVKDVMTHTAVPIPRFQGGHVSASYAKKGSISERQLVYHETDVPMYKGSSGCPGFRADGTVFGMHVAEWHDGGSKENPGQRAFSMWIPASAIISFARENNVEIIIS